MTCDSHPWKNIPLKGGWFPDAFIGTMSNLRRVAGGEESHLVSSIDDALATMALVEACCLANQAVGTIIPAI